MDILAHTLWTNAGARGANAIAKNKGKNWRVHVGWTAFWGVVPDFFAFTIPFILVFYKIILGGESFLEARESHHEILGGFNLANYLYQFSHSVVIFSLVFILVWIICRRPRWEMLGWLLHIIIDVPSHSIERYPTPFLFPISEYRFPYGISWAHPVYMIINYSLLAITWSFIAVKSIRKKGL